MQLENLESRQLLAVDLINTGITPPVVNEGGMVTLTGEISTTLPVTSGLRAWLDASDTSTIITDAAGNVERWLDKSGNENHAFEKIAAARPTWNPTAMNGRPAIRFDGVDDGMALADTLNITGAYTIFVVDQYYGAGQGRTLQSRDGAVNAGNNWLMGKWAGQNANFVGFFVAQQTNAGIFQPTIGVAQGGAGNASAYFVNGINLTGNGNPGNSPGHLGLGQEGTFRNNGTDNPTTADVAQILVYDRILSPAERQEVELFIAKKVNVGVGSAFTGGDAGEGLDLDGKFVYAVNAINPAVHPGQIRGASFTGDNVAGVSIPNQANTAFGTPNYGTSTNDDRLERLMSTIRHAGVLPGTIPIDLANLVVGKNYKLQLLFAENCCNRGFDIFAEGRIVGSNIAMRPLQNNVGTNTTTGGVFTYEFTAADTTLNLSLSGAGGAFQINATVIDDTNPILNGLTLEDLDAPTVPAPTFTTGTFTGGDAGEGLDLQGEFLYAVNARGPATGPVQGVSFTTDNVPGVTITAPNIVDVHANPNYGATPSDDNLEVVMRSLRWNSNPGTVSLDVGNLTPMTRYKLQLLFADNGAARKQDIVIEGVTVAADFNPGALQAGQFNAIGAVATYEFVATDSVLNIVFTPPTTPGADNNPIINGFTLEKIADPLPTPIANTVTVNWGDGTPNTILNLPLGQSSFSTNHVYPDNKPDGQPTGSFMPTVSVTSLMDGSSDTISPQVTGDALIDRTLNDGANGGLFLLDEPLTLVGRVTDWSFYDNDTAGRQITPLLIERVGDNYVIRGVGTTRASTGLGVQTQPFGVTAGSDAVTSNRFYMGWKDGSNTVNNAGVIDYNDLPASPANDGMRYFGDVVHLNQLNPGRNLGAGTLFGRDYSIQFTVTPAVTVNDVGPTAVAGSFNVVEGGSVTLTATATDPAGANDVISFQWDLDGDATFTPTLFTPTAVFSAAGLDGPSSRTFQVRAIDDDGVPGAVATGTINVQNAAPSLEISGPETTSPGFPTLFTFTATDPSAVDQAGNFLYTIDWGDGVIEANVPGTDLLELEHTYATLGPKVIKATVREAVNGTTSVQATFNLEVTPVNVIDGALVISGTSTSDRIVIQPGGNGVTVRINNKLVPAPAFDTKIIVLGLGGADTITLSGNIGAPAEVYGGAGNDYLTGGGGDDLIDGGDGNDRLYGGKGEDNIVGGTGNDSIYGGAGNDTLDGGEDKDTVNGDADNDTVLGGDGDDRVLGGTGNDYTSGDDGNDRVEGGAGDDLLLGLAGGDRLYGGAGNDVLLGGSQSDTLYGGTGDDLLAGDTTTNDEDEFALAFIWSTWSAGGIDAVGDLENEFNDSTIPDNDGFDTLYGEGGSDWLLHFLGDTLKNAGSTDVKQQLPTV